ncbi:hypothetical protein Zmor_021420 [Zophobas morio]|uniref:Uncharacterized protein n=1 Tax=Zophobas morio TaxID=2755281 RepID=A0AA38I2U9_9CUCU|nr:hypothetical protein Zmor_021420 [Zophobas morio]
MLARKPRYFSPGQCTADACTRPSIWQKEKQVSGKDGYGIHLSTKLLCVRPHSLYRDWDLFLICGFFFRPCPCPCCSAIRITRYSCSSVSLLIYSSSRSSRGSVPLTCYSNGTTDLSICASNGALPTNVIDGINRPLDEN